MDNEENVVTNEAEETPTPDLTIKVNKPKKKSKKKVVIIVLLVVFLVLFVFPPAFVFIFIYDTSKMKVTYDEAFDSDKWAESLVMDSLDNTVSEGAAKFSISESDVNNMLYQSYKDSEEMQQFVKQIAIDVRKNSYVFSISASLGFFNTRIQIVTNLSKGQVENRNGYLEDAYIFTIKDVVLGKVPGLKPFVMSILKQSIGDSFSSGDSQFEIHADLDHSRFYVFASDFRNMIGNALGGGSGSSNFYTSFIYDFLDNDLVDVDFYSNEALTIKVQLDKLTGNDYDEGQYVYYNMPYENTTTKLTINNQQKKLSLDTIREALVSLMDQGLIEESNLNLVSEYLFNGYHDDNAPDCDLNSIGIADKNTYQGFNVVTPLSVDDLIRNSVSSFDGYSPILTSFDIANLKEDDVNTFLHTQNIFGNKFFLTREVSDGKYKTSYIALDNAYINLTSNGAIISAGLNINGLETNVTMLMDIDAENSKNAKLAYTVNEIYYGSTDGEGNRITANDGTKGLLFQTLKNSVNSEAFTFTEDGLFIMDFSDLITQGINLIGAGQEEYRDFLLSGAKYSVKVVGDNVTDNSVIRVTASRF